MSFTKGIRNDKWRENRNRYRRVAGDRRWTRGCVFETWTKVAAIALANKIARMAWAMMAKGERYKEPVALAV
jgi:transposase